MIDFWNTKQNPITLLKSEGASYDKYKKKARENYNSTKQKSKNYVSQRKPIEVIKKGVYLKNGKYTAYFEYGYNSVVRKVRIKENCDTIEEAEKAYNDFVNTKSKHKGVNFCINRKNKNWYSQNKGKKKYFDTEQEALDWKNKTPNE